jgi:hypothetical protein
MVRTFLKVYGAYFSGKVRTASVTGVQYFAVFVDSYSGSKHVEFLTSKNHFIFGYKRFISYHHVVCSKDQHASNRCGQK